MVGPIRASGNGFLLPSGEGQDEGKKKVILHKIPSP
jgi:hypothetical protein